ncbi:MAG: hypothetical protein ACRCZI_04800, partial [Cetobacterium sp.]
MAKTPYNKLGALRKSDTLHKYVFSAAEFLSRVMSEPFTLQQLVAGKQVMDPIVAQRLAFIKKWDVVRPKREPYTMEMFATFHKQKEANEHKHGNSAFLGLHSLVYDTQTLGLFTGSRVSEYAQSKGQRAIVSRIPSRPGVPNPHPMAVAFVAGDFEFLSPDGHTVPHEVLFVHPERASQVTITFRHDKSGRSYTVRKFGRGSETLCPVTSAYRILWRAHLLQIPFNDPVCAYRPPRCSTHKWLLAREVTQTMRQICKDTYKSPGHYLHKNSILISSHSNRVTAAVALSQSRMSFDDIAQRL